jgi:CARDB protein
MLTTALGLAVLAAGTAGAGGAAAAPSPGGRSVPPASVRVAACVRTDHTAAFYARMRKVAGADRMGMHFTLLERSGDSPFQPVRVPGLGAWRKSRPGRMAFGFTQRVRSLVEGRAYRMRVDFRWYAKDGSVIRKWYRRSRTCRQFGRRPNLRVQILEAQATKVPDVMRYTVNLINDGHAPATNAAVRLSVDGAEADTKTVAFLARGTSRILNFRGPACKSAVEATADPDNTIGESSEADNAQTRTCAELRP